MGDVAGKATLPANARRIPVPAAALSQWLADIDDIVELKVTLRALALLADQPLRRRLPPSIALDDLLDDTFLASILSAAAWNPVTAGVAAAVGRGTLVAIRYGGSVRILLNDEGCHQYLRTSDIPRLSSADLIDRVNPDVSEPLPRPPTTGEPRANIFALYEQHIGPYGHSIAEQLRAAEEEYPAEWIAEAIAVAAERNARSWRYVEAVLRGWKAERAIAAGDGITKASRDSSHEHGKPRSDTAPDSLARYPYLESYWRRHGRLPWEPGESERG